MKPTRAVVSDLWLEYKTASQFEKRWASIEETLRTAAVLRGTPVPHSQDDDAAAKDHPPHYWMQQVEFDGKPPAWFTRDELGMGSTVSYFDTQRGLGSANQRRRLQWLRELAKEARELVERKVTQ